MRLFLVGIAGLLALGAVAIGARDDRSTPSPDDLARALRPAPVDQRVLAPSGMMAASAALP